MTVRDRASFPWATASLLALPSAGFAAAAGVVGAASPLGLGLFGASAFYLLFDFLVLQPRIESRMVAPNDIERSLEDFLATAGDFESVDDVARELSRAINRVSGSAANVALLAPREEGGIQVISPAPTLSGMDIGDRASAFEWLGDSAEPLWRRQLDGIEDTGAKDAAELMDGVGAEVLVPLQHRGSLLGMILISSKHFRRRAQREFLKGLRIYATTALANTFLDAQAQGRVGVTKTLGLANAIQESLMPEEHPVRRARWELCGLFRPVAACGGDLWGWRELPDHKVLIVAADATGHGAGPALLSAVAKGTMDAHAQLMGASCDPGELLAAMNRAILRVGRRTFMMTAFAVVVDIKKREMKFANAGQNFPFAILGGNLEALVVRGDQLGVLADATFQTHTKPIHPGDKILLYTDGIVEAGLPTSEGFGDRRFRKLVQSMEAVAAANIPSRILASVEEFLEGGAIHDDVTLVAFEFLKEDAEAL